MVGARGPQQCSGGKGGRLFSNTWGVRGRAPKKQGGTGGGALEPLGTSPSSFIRVLTVHAAREALGPTDRTCVHANAGRRPENGLRGPALPRREPATTVQVAFGRWRLILIERFDAKRLEPLCQVPGEALY